MLKKLLGMTATVTLCTSAAGAMCGYFGNREPFGGNLQVVPVSQPGQRAFITWDGERRQEGVTVQPEFSGNAKAFGMVIPTPSRPTIQEMPRDFFRALDAFTVLKPMNRSKFRLAVVGGAATSEMMAPRSAALRAAPPPQVRILERGMVGSLDYKILSADTSAALYHWLDENHYEYHGQEATLQSYVASKGFFTVMKIDSRHMKKAFDGTFQGDVTPSRFTFKVPHPVYPLRITQASVINNTDVQLYVMAHEKMDLGGDWSYEPNFLTMWGQAMDIAYPDKLTVQEQRWNRRAHQWKPKPNPRGARLEWAGKLTAERLKTLTQSRPSSIAESGLSGSAYPGGALLPAPLQAPGPRVRLGILAGHLKQGWTLTKIRKRFQKTEMTHDIELVPAQFNNVPDDLEYDETLPTTQLYY